MGHPVIREFEGIGLEIPKIPRVFVSKFQNFLSSDMFWLILEISRNSKDENRKKLRK